MYIGASPKFNDINKKWTEYTKAAYIASDIDHFDMVRDEYSQSVAQIINEFICDDEMSELQKHVKELWEESFSASAEEMIDLDTNFFDAGGDSISAIKIVAKLKDEGYEIDLADIYMLDTIRKIADYLEGDKDE